MAFWRQFYHLVWATKGREPFITEAVEPHLYRFIVSKAAELGVYVYAVNGWMDHVHVVAAIPPRHGTAVVVKRLKGASAHHLNHTATLDYRFAWQRGYGTLTMGEQQRPIAESYVAKQKMHHVDASTNVWLEYATAFDEGPPDPGGEISSEGRFVREDAPPYDAWGPLPF